MSLAVILLAGLILLTVTAVVLLRHGRRDVQVGPRCGSCGYNLTGCPSNRCPECGRLFIEAGVTIASGRPARRTLAVALATGLLVVLLLGACVSMMMWLRAERAAMAAQRAQAAQRAMLLQTLQAVQTNQATTRPAAPPTSP